VSGRGGGERNRTSVSTPSDTEIRVERVFDAPRELVWEVYTDPESMADWLGPRDHGVTIEAIDIRPGGSYRYTARGPGGDEYPTHGEYLEVVPPRLLVLTVQVEGYGEPWTQRVRFEQLDNGERTRLVELLTFISKEERDGKLEAGMERGIREGHDRLGELVVGSQTVLSNRQTRGINGHGSCRYVDVPGRLRRRPQRRDQ
jgi:uncharacterized protein YndB with AHSA1/START domain